MIIVGNGVDIVENSRIKKSIKNIKFIKRIYSSEEVKKSKLKTDKVSYFAKRFAAKEAFVKALGTGFSHGVYWKDIEIINMKSGHPKVELKGNAKNILMEMVPKNKECNISITITDENGLAQALVIIEVI